MKIITFIPDGGRTLWSEALILVMKICDSDIY